MANKPISQLAEVEIEELDPLDVIPIVNGGQTKKVTLQALADMELFTGSSVVGGAENGLYVFSTNKKVRLGGELLEHTQINQLDFDLKLKNGSFFSTGYASGSPNVPNESSPKMVWYANKGAFRAGITETDTEIGLTNNQAWLDPEVDSNIGKCSVAFGKNTIAKGVASVAMGKNARVSANAFTGVALGYNTQTNANFGFSGGMGAVANSQFAFSYGFNANANAQHALAFGSVTLASGMGAVAFGANTKATNAFGFVQGVGSEALGNHALAFGYQAIASGNQALAFGDRSQALGPQSFAFGTQAIATEDQAVAWGNKSEAKGENSFAHGNESLAYGDGSVAFGSKSKAMADYAFVFGYKSQAGFDDVTANNGMYAFAFGEEARAYSQHGFALGKNVLAGVLKTGEGESAVYAPMPEANYALAIGDSSWALADVSVAMGRNNKAKAAGAFVVGLNNESTGVFSAIIGSNNKIHNHYSLALGHNLEVSGSGAMVLGSGTSDTITGKLINSTANSLAIGFNSNIPTLFVGASSGTGTTGNVGVGTTDTTSKLTVNGMVESKTGGYKFPDGTVQTTALLAIDDAETSSSVKTWSINKINTFVDGKIASSDAVIFKGVIDCSLDPETEDYPEYPAADAGWLYRVSVAGKIGGASGVSVEVGDTLYCTVDATVSGTQDEVGANWSVVQVNMDGAVVGPTSSTDNHLALFDGTTGKLIKDSGVLLSDKQDTLVSATNIKTVGGSSLLGSGDVAFPTYTASNGITKSSNDFKLGGTLTENTSIDADTFQFNLKYDGVDAVDVKNRSLIDGDGDTSIDWENRLLKNDSGDSILKYNDSQVNLVNPSNGYGLLLDVSDIASSNKTIAFPNLSGDVPLLNDSATTSTVETWSANKITSFVDGRIASSDAVIFKGVIDCSSNPNYPAADAGWLYRVSVAGKIGGASGINVEVGDTLYCTADGTSSGNHATVGSNWSVVQVNIDGAVVGPTTAVNNNVALFDGTTGKLIKDSGLVLTDAGSSQKGIMKLYSSTGTSTDGTMDRNSITNALVPQIAITTAVSIDTTTTDSNGLGQKGRTVCILNSANAINYTVNASDGFTASFLKIGTATITFVQGSGRTLVQVDGSNLLDGAAGSTAVIMSVGTTDYLLISNV